MTIRSLLIMLFVAYSSATLATNNKLPKNSQLISIGDKEIHVRVMGEKHKNIKPTIVLLSGPNENWHSDSAWFALLQPMLAQNYHVISIDRAGNAFSTTSDNPSYRLFAQKRMISYKIQAKVLPYITLY